MFVIFVAYARTHVWDPTSLHHEELLPHVPANPFLTGDVEAILPDDPKQERRFGVVREAGTTQSTIVVAIPSYRDPECAWSIHDLYEKAREPGRVRVVVVEHVRFRNESCASYYDLGRCGGSRHPHVVCAHSQNVFISTHAGQEARGPLSARHMLQGLVGEDDDFLLMVDAHSQFMHGWDVGLVENWNELHQELAVITTRPLGFASSEQAFRAGRRVRALCRTAFSADRRLPHHLPGRPVPKGRSLLLPFWSASLSFSKAHSARTVMYDGFASDAAAGEEFAHGYRLWTHGYEFWSPRDNYVLHLSGQRASPFRQPRRTKHRYTENGGSSSRAGTERLRRMLNLTAVPPYNTTGLDRFGPGTARSRAAYGAFAGIEWNHEEGGDRCAGLFNLTVVPLRSRPSINYRGVVTFPSPDLPARRRRLALDGPAPPDAVPWLKLQFDQLAPPLASSRVPNAHRSSARSARRLSS